MKHFAKLKKCLAFLLVIIMCAAFVPNNVQAAEDYRTWDQGDSRWGSLSLGSSDKTVKSSGCLVTSVTKLIIQAGFKNPEDFTPATLVKWLNNNGGFSGSSLVWSKPAEYISGMSFIGKGSLIAQGTYSSSGYNDKIVNWVKNGYHMVVCVKGGGHWVAVDEAMTLKHGEVYIMDTLPSNQNADLTLASRYSEFTRIEAYTGGTTPDGSDTEPEIPDEDVENDEPAEEPEEPPVEEPDEQPEEPPVEEPDEQPEEPDENPTVQLPFSDVKEDDWYYEAVKYVYENEYMSGYSANAFAPNDSLSRGQFARILYNMNGVPEVEYQPVFEDVPDGEWYTDGIMWAYENGIVSGYGDGNFGTNDPITREQLTFMMYRYAKLIGYDVESQAELNDFSDMDEVSSYAEESMRWAVDKRIVNGKVTGSEKYLDPKGTATRAECAQIIKNFVGAYEE